ncbi:hypothetical protein HPB47_006149, partial [Ixodes persulcatus]
LRGLRFGDATLPDRHCALYFATVRAHTAVSLLTVSGTSRTYVSGKRVLELKYTLAITCLHSFEIFAKRIFENIRAGEESFL